MEQYKLTIISPDKSKLSLTIASDSDLYDWVNILKTILQWLTFSEESIKEVFKDEEDEG